MSTLAQLISLTDLLYPNSETSANKVIYMNLAQDKISAYVGLIVEDTTKNTVADDDNIAFPSGCTDISQIITFDVSNSPPDTDAIVTSASMKVGTYTIAAQPAWPARISVTHTANGSADTLGTITIAGTVAGSATTEVITPSSGTTVYGSKYFTAITSVTGASWVTNGTADTITVGVSSQREDFTRYEKGYIDDVGYNGHVIYQIYTSAGVKSLVIYPAPDETGCNIKIRYRKALTAMDSASTSASPDFDNKYHSILAYFAAWSIANNSASPDTVRANQLRYEYEMLMNDLWKNQFEMEEQSLKKRTDNRQWH